MWDLFYDADSVRKMLVEKIQEESLRTYLFTYSNVYDSISLVSYFFADCHSGRGILFLPYPQKAGVLQKIFFNDFYA